MVRELVSDARHYTLANVDAVWDAGNPIVLPIVGTPQCALHIHPANSTITLTTPFTPPEPNVAKWRNINFRPVASDEGDLAELTVVVEDNLHAAYGLLTSVADQMQLGSEPLAAAVAVAIAQHRGMFAGKAALSEDKEVGLFGELLVLEYLIDKIGPGPAMEAWQGPLNEEHDFVFDNIHLEIKTTSAEHRRHMMHGVTQLVPLHGVPLSLISIQLTRSSPSGGRTLARLVAQLRAAAGGHRPRVDDALDAWGWKDEDADLYTSNWARRTAPRAYAVTEPFPALTLARLVQVVPNLNLVSDLSYRVDLSQFTSSTLPGPLADLVEAP